MRIVRKNFTEEIERSEKEVGEVIELLTKKGVFCYDYVDSWEKLEEAYSPIECFFNQLTNSGIDQKSYDHGKRVWNTSGCRDLGIMAFYQTLNKPAYPPKLKVADMVIGKPYRILAGRMVNSPWGETCLLEIQDGEQIRTIYLPQKISQSVKANSRQFLPAFNSGKDFVTHLERQRYQLAVSTGKRRKRSDLSERELALVRRKDREKKRLKRLKDEEVTNPETSSNKSDNPADSTPKTRKKLVRLVLENSSEPSCSDSPKSKTDAFLATEPSKDAIRKKLVFGEALKQDIKSRYETTSKIAEKQYLANLTRGRVVKKYRISSEVKRNVTPAIRIKIRDDFNLMNFKKKQRAAVEITRKSLENFYCENSIIDPGENAYVTVNGEKFQERYLQTSLTDLHQRYLKQINYHMGFTTFTKYRPSYCVAPKVTERDTCARHVHENFSLLVQSLFKNEMIPYNSSDKILSELLCAHRTDECFSRECPSCNQNNMKLEIADKESDEIFNYLQWITEKETRISARTKKEIQVQVTKKVLMTCKISNLEKLFHDSLRNFVEHEGRIFHQQNFWKNIENVITLSDLLFILDFSQNWLGKCTKEVHALHFGASRPQFSLHTGMLYSQLLNEGFTTISESLSHDAIAIVTHLKNILDFYLPRFPLVTNLGFLSDGPTTQYKNRFAIHAITQFLLPLYPQILTFSWNFSEAGHGKGPADGIGAVVKRAADDKVKYGADIMDLDSLMSALGDSVEKIHISPVSSDDISQVESQIDKVQAKAFVGLTKVHQYTWSEENPKQVFFNTLSCSACFPGVRCDHYCIRLINYDVVPNSSKKRKSTLEQPSKKTSKKVKRRVVEKMVRMTSKEVLRRNKKK
ncbi:hypothetical protein QAD02_013850 [Eretmocerus hayati]|uniref:Uncharacterized protein n=1 Tax=Eretmocerus hayati TaxID=131215 RepID=A0ACC2P4N3_9HYME|nr:hypothetical protein QAD02_013850 [Eretmocerus hayati]